MKNLIFASTLSAILGGAITAALLSKPTAPLVTALTNGSLVKLNDQTRIVRFAQEVSRQSDIYEKTHAPTNTMFIMILTEPLINIP